MHHGEAAPDDRGNERPGTTRLPGTARASHPSLPNPTELQALEREYQIVCEEVEAVLGGAREAAITEALPVVHRLLESARGISVQAYRAAPAPA